MSRFDTYKDDSLFPWGRHKGKKMIDVPAPYLIWLGDEIRAKRPKSRTLTEHEILYYIDDNKQVLEKQVKEGQR